MRIHIVTLRLKEHGGGSHQNLLAFVRGLRGKGHEVVVHTMFSEGNEPPGDVSIHPQRGEGLSFFALQQLAADVMRENENNADIMLVYGQALLWSGGIYRSFGGRIPVAVYLDSHLDSMKEAYRDVGFVHRLMHLLWEKTKGLSLTRRVDRFLAVSPYLKERYTRFGFDEEKFAVVPNAFDFSPAPEHESHDVPRILFVGRLSYEKAPDLLLKALSQVQALSWEVRFVGDGPMRNTLEAFVRSHKLTKRVEITGWKASHELSDEYAAADIMVLSSRVPEPFGRTVVEAMHAGVAVVVPEQGGAAWVAENADVTFKNRDARSLASMLSGLLDEPERRRELAERGRKRAALFDSAMVIPKLATELTSLVRAHTP